MKMTNEERQIVILTDSGKTLEPNVGNLTKLIDTFGGNFREMRIFFNDIKRKNKGTYLYLSMPDNLFLDAEKNFDSYNKKSELLSLESIIKTRAPHVLIINLKYEIFKKFYKNRLKHVLPSLNPELIIFIGSFNVYISLKTDGFWSSNYHFFERSGVSRIGRENQRKIKMILNI